MILLEGRLGLVLVVVEVLAEIAIDKINGN
jgi:hypothetical protein